MIFTGLYLAQEFSVFPAIQHVSDHLSPYFFERSPDGFFVR